MKHDDEDISILLFLKYNFIPLEGKCYTQGAISCKHPRNSDLILY